MDWLTSRIARGSPSCPTRTSALTGPLPPEVEMSTPYAASDDSGRSTRTIDPLSNCGRLAAPGRLTNSTGGISGTFGAGRGRRRTGRAVDGRTSGPTVAGVEGRTDGTAGTAHHGRSRGERRRDAGHRSPDLHHAPAQKSTRTEEKRRSGCHPSHPDRRLPGRTPGATVLLHERRQQALLHCRHRFGTHGFGLRQHRLRIAVSASSHTRHLVTGFPDDGSGRIFAASNARPRCSLERIVPTAQSRAAAAST